MVTARVLTLAMLAAAAMPGPADPILIIGHRGASGYRPEHTLESYSLAIEMGADVIEPDLVMTRDGVLIVRHENEIGGTTDAAEKFPARKTTKQIDGAAVAGWFTEDFTLAEIQTLRARERLAFRSHEFDGKFVVPTFAQVLDFVKRKSRDTGREIGVYPETKHPTYFRAIGLPLEEPLLALLKEHALTKRASPVFIQSFEPSSLRRMRSLTQVRLVQLLDVGADVSPAKLAEIKTYADGVGLNKNLVIPVSADGNVFLPTSVVRASHEAHLFVHVWTMRKEPPFLPLSYGGDLGREIQAFADLGVDGIFTDFPDVATAVLRKKK